MGDLGQEAFHINGVVGNGDAAGKALVIKGDAGTPLGNQSQAQALLGVVFGQEILIGLGHAGKGRGFGVGGDIGGLDDQLVFPGGQEGMDLFEKGRLDLFQVDIADAIPMVPKILGVEGLEPQRADALNVGGVEPVGQLAFTGGSDGPVQGGIKDQFPQRGTPDTLFGRQYFVNNAGQIHFLVQLVDGKNGAKFLGGKAPLFQGCLDLIGSTQVDLVNGGGFTVNPLSFPNIIIFVAFFHFFIQMCHNPSIFQKS